MTSSKSMRELLLEATKLEKTLAQQERPDPSLMAQTPGQVAGQTTGPNESTERQEPGQGSSATST